MKKIECIINPAKLIDLEKQLYGVVTGLTVTHVKGCGTQKGETQYYRGTALTVNLLPKIKVETVVEEARFEEVLEIIRAVCQTGNIGDGKIFISSLEDVVRIRTWEHGVKALRGDED